MTSAPGHFEDAYDMPLLKYDAWNRLVRVDLGPLNPYATFEYDGLGQRIVQVNNGIPNDGTFNYYYNDNWQLLTEVKGGSVEAIYHWHPHYVDALALRMRASDTHFFLQDANFNVTAAVNDDGNAVDERYGYTPYGEPTILDADFTADSVNDDGYSDIDNRHLYTGREFEIDPVLRRSHLIIFASSDGGLTGISSRGARCPQSKSMGSRSAVNSSYYLTEPVVALAAGWRYNHLLSSRALDFAFESEVGDARYSVAARRNWVLFCSLYAARAAGPGG
jgi:hypothetical protein